MSIVQRVSNCGQVIFIAILLILYFPNLSSGSLGGAPDYFAFQPVHNVFYDQEYAEGLVRMGNGFTVAVTVPQQGPTVGSCAYMDTCISVSGAIDLRDANTIFLNSDLSLDHGVTLSSGGNIYGYDRALILHGDLTIPDGKVIHTGGKIVIDGNGHKLLLGDSAQLFVDTDATLTLKNLVLQNVKNQPGHPAIQCAASGSRLCLDGVELALADDFYFNRGQLFIHNDVVVTGTSSFVYRSTNPSYISTDSSFYFDLGTTLDFRPSTTGTPQLLAKDLLSMQGVTSQLYLNGCSLKTTMTGMRLTTGQLIFDNRVTMTSAAQLQLKSTGTAVYVNYEGWTINSTKISVDGRYVAVSYNNSSYIEIYDMSLGLTASQDNGAFVNSLNWSPDGRYLVVSGTPAQSGDAIQIYSFNGSSLTFLTYDDHYDSVKTAIWSPDGRYLAMCGSSSEQQPIEVFSIWSFDGIYLTLIDSQIGTQFDGSLCWGPDGRFIAIGDGGIIQIYSFDGSSLFLVTTTGSFSSVRSIDWGPDGRSLGVGADGEILVYGFDGVSLGLITSENYGNYVYSVNWSFDGRYIAIGGGFPDVGHNQLEIYKFDGLSLTITASEYYGAGEDGAVASVNWSSDDKKLAVGGYTSESEHGGLAVYTLQYGPETQVQALSNSIVFGNSALGSDYDLKVRALAGAQVVVDGLLNDDDVN